MNNPFSLDFGAKPELFIARNSQSQTIINMFTAEHPSTHIYMIIGARGTGKTVLMTSISKDIKDEKKWIHIDLNSDVDMLQSLASNIYKKGTKPFPKVKQGANIKGVSVSVEQEKKYSDIQSDIDTMLESLKKQEIRVLITIDEAVNSKNIRAFSTYFQHCMREEYPVFVIMTGLYKNIRALQNNRSHTFLRRAPKIVLGPLNIDRITKVYEETFSIQQEDARRMSEMTGGYSYAFQILGFLLYDARKKKVDDDILFEYKINLIENSYEKIWEELSINERQVLVAMSEFDKTPSVKDVRSATGFDSNNFSTYQNTLEKSGILSQDTAYGYLGFSLPFFKEFVNSNKILK